MKLEPRRSLDRGGDDRDLADGRGRTVVDCPLQVGSSAAGAVDRRADVVR